VERRRLLRSTGNLTVDTWSGCGSGAWLGFATYRGGTHVWPAGDAATPGAGPVICQFVSGQPW
jgi:hypothetical protein